MKETYTIAKDDYILIYYKIDKYGDPLISVSDLSEAYHAIKNDNPDKKVYALPDTINVELTNKETLCENIIEILKQLKPNIIITEVDDGK